MVKTLNRLIDDKQTMQVIIDIEMHKQLKILSAKSQQPIKQLVEQALIEVYDFVSLNEDDL